MDCLQALDEILAASDKGRKFVGAVLLFPRHEVADTKEPDKVPLQQGSHDRVHYAQNGNASESSDRSDIFEDTDERRFGSVNPRTEAGIATIVVGEFVGQHGAELGNSHR